MNDRIKELTVKAGFPEWSNHAIEFELDQFARQLYSTPNSRVENDGISYAKFLYGDMPSAKESTPDGNMQRVKDNYRYTLY